MTEQEKTVIENMADVIEAAMDNVHDMDLTFRQYAEAAAKALLDEIKPLEWITLPRIIADTEIGDFVVEFDYEDQGWGFWSPVCNPDFDLPKTGFYETEQEAKDAASADYRATILSAFTEATQ